MWHIPCRWEFGNGGIKGLVCGNHAGKYDLRDSKASAVPSRKTVGSSAPNASATTNDYNLRSFHHRFVRSGDVEENRVLHSVVETNPN